MPQRLHLARMENIWLLASGFEDGHIEVQKAENWTEAFGPLVAHTSIVSCLDFSPDTQRLASGSLDGTIRLWNTKNGRGAGVVHSGESIGNIGFSPDGLRIVSHSFAGALQIRIVTLMQKFDHAENVHNEEKVKEFALSGDGKRVLILTYSDRFVMRDALDGKPILEIGAPVNVSSIALDQCGRRAVFANCDGTIHLLSTKKTVERSQRPSNASFVEL